MTRPYRLRLTKSGSPEDSSPRARVLYSRPRVGAPGAQSGYSVAEGDTTCVPPKPGQPSPDVLSVVARPVS
jgi:hypothetical protein